MYGIGSALNSTVFLEKVHTLKSRIIRIKNLKKGDTIGYNATEVLSIDTQIAILPIGYADGIFRKAGNRSFSCVVNGIKVPILGMYPWI